MAINIWRWLFGGKKSSNAEEITVEELCGYAEELGIRLLAFNVCANMIANAIGKCEFKTFLGGKPVRGLEYYTLNYEPNINQNSSAFWHEAICKLLSSNEVLIISTRHRDGHEMLACADSWENPLKYPAKMREYRSVRVGEVTYEKTFRENEVIHLTLNDQNVKAVIDQICGSYQKLITAAERYYTRSRGIRMKVKVSQIAEGDSDFTKNFQSLIDAQIKPFMQADNAVLTEFDGYEYSDMGKDGSGSKISDSEDIRDLINDIFTFTARGLGIPPVLVTGDVAGTQDAVTRWLTTCIDPIAEQIQEELTRKRYGYERWVAGDFIQVDTTAIIHFDMFANAANVEKLIGSGAFSINDVLIAAGLPRIDAPWANQHWLTKNIAQIEAAASALDNGGKGGSAE